MKEVKVKKTIDLTKENYNTLEKYINKNSKKAGTGHHISIKKDIIKNVLQDKKVIIVDVNNEYKELVDSINSDNVKLINIKNYSI